ncbi:MAG: response regulator transcription factor [Beijerinckiaceae bacterium]|nr:response regulator transcription factor [Beijerinckiaceae bacterium]MCZ8301510.1 response regulator transcription factor [Beijerinckiaceae bacterium]
MAEDHKRIAVVDDEDDLRDAVVEYLAMNGFEVEGFARGSTFREAIEAAPFDLAVLDIAMPGEDGLSVARWLRGKGFRTGIIFATAAGTPIDRIIGLELGADDYIVKPCELREVLARVRSVLRRLPAAVAPTAAVAPEPSGKRLRFGGMVLDLDSRVLLDPKGAPMDLTALELDLLMVLATRAGRPLSRSQILDYSGNGDTGDTERAVDIRITRLRKKIEPNPDTPRYIKTVRGVGYVFVGD